MRYSDIRVIERSTIPEGEAWLVNGAFFVKALRDGELDPSLLVKVIDLPTEYAMLSPDRQLQDGPLTPPKETP